jgi:O-antigen ligase
MTRPIAKRREIAVVGRQPGHWLGHYVGVALFLIAVVWLPGTADQFVGPRMVILAALGIGILPYALVRWLSIPAKPTATQGAVGGFVAFALWAAVSAIGSGAPLALSIFGWWGRDVGLLTIWGALGLLIAAVTLSARQILQALSWALLGAAVVALIGLLQLAGLRIAEGVGGIVTLNMGNANFAAAYAGITASLAAGMALRPSLEPWWRAAVGVLAVVLVALSLATGSLQGPLTALLGIWIVLGLSARLRPSTLARRLSLTWIAVSGLLVLLVLASFAGLGPIASIWREDTIAIRVEYWRTSFAVTEGLPLFGSGPDGFARYLGEFRPESYVEILGPANNVSAAHNIALNWAATLGLPALLLWMAAVGAVLWLVVRKAIAPSREGRSVLLPGIAGAFVAYLAQGMVSIDMIPLMSLGWVLAGMMIALACTPDDADSPRFAPATARSSGVTLTLAAGAAVAVIAGVSASVQVLKTDGIRSADSPEAAISFMTDSLVPCDARREVTEQVLKQLPIEQSVDATIRATRLDPRCPYMVNLEADATIKVRAMAEATVATAEGVAFDPLYDVSWVLKARRELILGQVEAARTSAAEAERVQSLYPESQRDFGLIRNLEADIRSVERPSE